MDTTRYENHSLTRIIFYFSSYHHGLYNGSCTPTTSCLQNPSTRHTTGKRRGHHVRPARRLPLHPFQLVQHLRLVHQFLGGVFSCDGRGGCAVGFAELVAFPGREVRGWVKARRQGDERQGARGRFRGEGVQGCGDVDDGDQECHPKSWVAMSVRVCGSG